MTVSGPYSLEQIVFFFFFYLLGEEMREVDLPALEKHVDNAFGADHLEVDKLHDVAAPLESREQPDLVLEAAHRVALAPGQPDALQRVDLVARPHHLSTAPRTPIFRV